MNKYEMLYILKSDLTDEVRDSVIAKFEKIVTTAGGEVEKIDKWGVKKLAYEINKKREGYYVLVNFTADVKVPNKLGSLLAITNGSKPSSFVSKKFNISISIFLLS